MFFNRWLWRYIYLPKNVIEDNKSGNTQEKLKLIHFVINMEKYGNTNCIFSNISFFDFVCLTKNLKIRRKRPSLSRCDGNLTKSEKAKNFVKIWQKMMTKDDDKIQIRKRTIIGQNLTKMRENVGKCGRCGRQIERSERASQQQSILWFVAQLDVIRETPTKNSPSSFGHCPI